jgi:glyoxylase-like metal-dependent hydrolase (beta-lactamase superfamily II)
MHQLGDISISRVIESEQPFINLYDFIPDATEDVLEANRDWLIPKYIDPKNMMIILNIQSYVLRTPKHTILVDACVGNHKDRPGRPMFHQLNTPYLETLAAAGVQPEDIDIVMCTHLHVDHVGWNTRLVNGRWVPTFPNAKYVFARKEHDFWLQREKDGSQGPVPNVYEDSVLPVVEAGLAVLVDSDHEIDHGISLEPAPGHTPGNIVLNLSSGGSDAVLSGDVIHHPIQLVRPEWSSRACEDRMLSAKTRRALIERYADTNTLIAPAHFASPTMGHICSHGDGFGFKLLGEG